MSKIILVTGGARSGKSNFAEKLCFDRNNNTAYIATSIPFDDEMKDRVKNIKRIDLETGILMKYMKIYIP